jgi:hypothetical protein
LIKRNRHNQPEAFSMGWLQKNVEHEAFRPHDFAFMSFPVYGRSHSVIDEHRPAYGVVASAMFDSWKSLSSKTAKQIFLRGPEWKLFRETLIQFWGKCEALFINLRRAGSPPSTGGANALQ